jgi:hypothetical protein
MVVMTLNDKHDALLERYHTLLNNYRALLLINTTLENLYNDKCKESTLEMQSLTEVIHKLHVVRLTEKV